MKTPIREAIILLSIHQDRFNRRDFLRPRRWWCLLVGHDVVDVAATFGYLSDGRQVKGVIALPACRRCAHLLDYRLMVGSPDKSTVISEPTVTVHGGLKFA